MKLELSVLNKKWKTNGIKWRKVAQGNLDITRTWGRVQSDKRHGYSLGAMHIQLGNLRCAIVRVMGTRELPAVTGPLSVQALDSSSKQSYITVKRTPGDYK